MFGLPFLDAAFRSIRPVLYTDSVDKMHYYGTTLMLLFFSILVSAKQYVGSPVQCWLPAEFRGGWEEYVEDYCFVQNTYFSQPMKALPQSSAVDEAKYKVIGYYQWVPVMLAVQAVMFYIPHFLWKTCHWYSGLSLKTIMQSAKQSAGTDINLREKHIANLARYIEDALGLQKVLNRPWMVGSYVTCLYLFVKALNMINIIGQFCLLNGFLGTGGGFWGFELLADLSNGREWTSSGYFPRVTFCDYNYQTFVNVEYRTTQCVLMINMFNEKLYIFVWFWFFILAICTAANVIFWTVVSLVPSMRSRTVHRYLRVSAHIGDTPTDRRLVRQFTSKALCCDGTLVLRFVAAITGEMVATDLAAALWRDYENNVLSTKTHQFGLLETLDDYGTKKGEASRHPEITAPLLQPKTPTVPRQSARNGYNTAASSPKTDL